MNENVVFLSFTNMREIETVYVWSGDTIRYHIRMLESKMTPRLCALGIGDIEETKTF
jgi:hypothetical protein